MIEQNFIDSSLKKIKHFFFQKRISDVIILSDGDDDLIDNVIYIKSNDEHIGIYINGTNPYFSKSYIEDLDLFNLYENYSWIDVNEKENSEIRIDSINLVFNSDYNELIGLYIFNSKIKERSFSLIFKGNELTVLEDITFEKYKIELNSQLLHVENKRLYVLDSGKNNWNLESYS